MLTIYTPIKEPIIYLLFGREMWLSAIICWKFLFKQFSRVISLCVVQVLVPVGAGGWLPGVGPAAGAGSARLPGGNPYHQHGQHDRHPPRDCRPHARGALLPRALVRYWMVKELCSCCCFHNREFHLLCNISFNHNRILCSLCSDHLYK